MAYYALNYFFKSYLWNRRQSVSFNNFVSTTQLISSGIPQGSILDHYCLLSIQPTFSTKLTILICNHMLMTFGFCMTLTHRMLQ